MVRRQRYCRGFTVFEVLLVSGLMVLMVMLLAAAWAGLGRPSSDLLTRCHITQEINSAAAHLASDFGGGLPGDEARLGKQEQGQLVGFLLPTEAQLWLCFDGGTEPNKTADWAPPDTIVTYQVVNGALVRQDQSAGISQAVANHVDSLEATPGDNSTVLIKIKCIYRGLERTYTLSARVP